MIIVQVLASDGFSIVDGKRVDTAVQAKQVESAVALWRRMQEQGVRPSADNCNALLTACLDCQHNERALMIFQQAQAMGEDPATSISQLIANLAVLPALYPGRIQRASYFMTSFSRAFLRICMTSGQV